ncbi:hypothetical protein K737_300073 [Holospora undulata HU1]|uniref:Uncharacterized protein n=1 Tax=Holospora undulata HU1 TaxID=1321371 RepID=A0A061JIN9_9PROT|nr:hypothetical protein K737_300073 [Holospora undulata HU1]
MLRNKQQSENENHENFLSSVSQELNNIEVGKGILKTLQDKDDKFLEKLSNFRKKIEEHKKEKTSAEEVLRNKQQSENAEFLPVHEDQVAALLQAPADPALVAAPAAQVHEDQANLEEVLRNKQQSDIGEIIPSNLVKDFFW